MATGKDFEEERDKIVKGLEEVYRRLVLYKIEKKSPFVISRKGKVVEVDPNEMPRTIRYKRAIK
jgi:hypothetical protein